MRRVLLTAAAAVVRDGVGQPGAKAQLIGVFHLGLLSGGNETPVILTGAVCHSYCDASICRARRRCPGSSTCSESAVGGINNAHFPRGRAWHCGADSGEHSVHGQPCRTISASGSATSATARPADQGIRSWEDFLQGLAGGQMYLNIHTAVNGGGEIRGQVIRGRRGERLR